MDSLTVPKYNSAEKGGKISRIIQTHFLKSEKLLTLIIKENHSNFGAKMSATGPRKLDDKQIRRMLQKRN